MSDIFSKSDDEEEAEERGKKKERKGGKEGKGDREGKGERKGENRSFQVHTRFPLCHLGPGLTEANNDPRQKSNVTPFVSRDPIKCGCDPTTGNWDLCGPSNCLDTCVPFDPHKGRQPL